MDIYELVIGFHFVVSSIFFILSAVVITWAVIGWVKDLKGSKVFNRLSFFFIHVLYIELITGIILYFFLHPESRMTGMSMEEAAAESAFRFWAIEHISLMMFALILSQVGRLLIKQMSVERKRYRAATLYFGTSFIVVLSSAAMSIFR